MLELLLDESIYWCSWVVLHTAGIEDKNIGHFDDAWFGLGDDGRVIACVQTKNGGGHHNCIREPKCDPEIDDPDDLCCDCVMENAHNLFENYIDHELVSFDSRCINMLFSVLPEYEKDVLALMNEFPEILGQRADYEEYREKFIHLLQNPRI